MNWTLFRNLRTSGLRLILLAGLLLAANTPAAQAHLPLQTDEPPAGAGPAYLVQAGDTLFGIAAEFGTTLEALQNANPGINANALSIGQQVIIPGFEEFTGATLQIHEVALGETLASIARSLNLPASDLMRLNRVVNPGTVYLGQPIVYPDSGATQPVAGARLRAAGAGGGLLTAAAAQNAQPWSVAALNDLASPVLTLGGLPVYVPEASEDAAFSGLPAPLVNLTLDPPAAIQGQTLEIRVDAAEAVTVNGTLSQFGAVAPPPEWSPFACLYPTRTLHFAQEGTTSIALQGVCALAPPGVLALDLTLTDTAGNATSFSQLLPLREGDYAQESLTVAAETLDAETIQREVDAIRAVGTLFSPDRLWNGVFQKPSEFGEYRSYFGTRRSYNDGPFDSYHAGLDYSGQTGTPVLAPAPGIVVLTEPNFIVYGGVTWIDHGWGVFTGYLHQSKIEVAVGDRVTTGQEIGLVGSTGRVTGPHLHWEIWVGGVPVEPLEWLERPFP